MTVIVIMMYKMITETKNQLLLFTILIKLLVIIPKKKTSTLDAALKTHIIILYRHFTIKVQYRSSTQNCYRYSTLTLPN